jgi:lysophospholipase L1-like esterase
LGPLPSGSPSPDPSSDPSSTVKPLPLLPKGSKVAFFGDSQGSTLILNKPADLGEYIEASDATITGCGILLGKVGSRTGERRNLSSNCPNWLSEWQVRAQRLRPDLAIVMLGAWDVFDLILDSGQTLTFGTPEWDAHYTEAVRTAVDAVLTGTDAVAFSLLPCYRPIEASAGFWPERGDDDRTRHVNELLTSVAASYPTGVYTVEPPTEFCTDPNIATNTSYRWDGIHYYKKGSALYFSAVLPQILQP